MAGVNVVGKSSWPELVGKNGGDAAATIIRENPKVFVVIIPPLVTPIIGDSDGTRVRVVVDDRFIVTNVPTIG
ncbi:hypothetical protein CDL15_Pgr008444 [Punica granatum]|uniref:Uncharacterized protein n=1 Tax=Punica granatum TaxID=22663 RepID=A0A218WNE0_PUNGR|nr:hypothetical protein CDL15_Pgr008444 [Punica granatum]PKI46304.1 hypothetical protein CRG98_033313 [Punica granatum]